MTPGEKRHQSSLKIMQEMLSNLHEAQALLHEELSEDNPDNQDIVNGQTSLKTFSLKLRNDAHNCNITILHRPYGNIKTVEHLDERGNIEKIGIEIFHKEYVNADGEPCIINEIIHPPFRAAPVFYNREVIYPGNAVENLTHELKIRQEVDLGEHVMFEPEKGRTAYINVKGGDAAEGVEIGSVAFFCEKLLEIKSQFTDSLAKAPIAAGPKKNPPKK